jgi:hypothetical protein
MNKILFSSLLLLFFIFFISCSQSSIKFDLASMHEKNELDIYNRDISLINENSYQGIKLSKAFGEGLAKIKNFEFSNGSIEFDVRGENVKMHSIVGLAFPLFLFCTFKFLSFNTYDK